MGGLSAGFGAAFSTLGRELSSGPVADLIRRGVNEKKLREMSVKLGELDDFMTSKDPEAIQARAEAGISEKDIQDPNFREQAKEASALDFIRSATASLPEGTGTVLRGQELTKPVGAGSVLREGFSPEGGPTVTSELPRKTELTDIAPGKSIEVDPLIGAQKRFDENLRDFKTRRSSQEFQKLRQKAVDSGVSEEVIRKRIDAIQDKITSQGDREFLQEFKKKTLQRLGQKEDRLERTAKERNALRKSEGRLNREVRKQIAKAKRLLAIKLKSGGPNERKLLQDDIKTINKTLEERRKTRLEASTFDERVEQGLWKAPKIIRSVKGAEHDRGTTALEDRRERMLQRMEDLQRSAPRTNSTTSISVSGTPEDVLRALDRANNKVEKLKTKPQKGAVATFKGFKFIFDGQKFIEKK